MQRDFDDETLMAYADGELSPERIAEVERAMVADGAVASRVALFERTRRAVADDAAAHPIPPVSDALLARIHVLAARAASGSSTVVTMAQRPRRPPWHLPVAASIALAVGLGAGVLAGRQEWAAPGLQIAALDDPDIVAALDTMPSGERMTLPGGDGITAIASFRGGEGDFCRELEYDRPEGATVVAVACRSLGVWEIRFAVVATASGATGYAPASSLEALDAYITSTGAGAPMSPDEERAALSAF